MDTNLFAFSSPFLEPFSCFINVSIFDAIIVWVSNDNFNAFTINKFEILETSLTVAFFIDLFAVLWVWLTLVVFIEEVKICASDTNYWASVPPFIVNFFLFIRISILKTIFSYRLSYSFFKAIIVFIQKISFKTIFTYSVVIKTFTIFVDLTYITDNNCAIYRIIATFSIDWISITCIASQAVSIRGTPSLAEITNFDTKACLLIFVVTIRAFYAISTLIEFIAKVIAPWSYCLGNSD